MKKMILLVALIVATANAYAGTSSMGKVERAFTENTVVAGTGFTTITRTFNIASIKNMGIWWKLNAGASNGNSHTLVYMEASYDDTPGNFATVTTMSRNTQTAATVNSLTFPDMKYVRFRATGAGTQATDSTITAYVFTQE